MAITDLIPWKKDETSVPVRRRQGEEAFLDLRKQMNRLFDEFFERPFGLSPFFGDSTLWGDFAPQMDVSETDKEITISAELPGAEPEDIHITLDRNILTISGEKRAEKEEGGKRFYRVERSYGSFRRSIPLPEGVDEDQIDANFKRGVLKVKLPKTAEAQKKSKRITIKTD
ncbi:MAG: Hsp20/alpha crystallin family protein [Anaerolineales bacterium]|jgi:HSP20 family protein